MGAATNVTTVHYGTTWDDATLLEEVKQANLEMERRDGIKRHFRYDWEAVAACNPDYRAYVEGERARLGERLRVTVDVPEALEAAQVPPLSLQVLVENAVKHGVAPLEQGGEVRIGAEQKERVLHLWVEDPGPGVSSITGTGTALATLRQRLEKPEDLDMGLVEGRHRVGFRWRQV